jgi:hypothetical protein
MMVVVAKADETSMRLSKRSIWRWPGIIIEQRHPYRPLTLVLALTAFGAPALAADQTWRCMAPADLGKHEVSGENLILSGIQISEGEGELAHLPVIRGAFTARNKSAKDFHVALEILGLDDKGPVFAMSVAPGFAGTVSPNSNQPATATVFAAPGEFARAIQICVRFVGDF